MPATLSSRTLILSVSAAILSLSTSVSAGKKLQIFILAGQSNMVGHANPHTIATLTQTGSARDKELLQMVFGEGSGVTREAVDKQLAQAARIDELTGGISNEKVKNMADGPDKKALQAKVQTLKNSHEAYKKAITSACRDSDRVYINSIADGSRKSGKLGVGYGAGGQRIGPEYGFGLSIARKVEGPILLIKTSWGGKSLNYDFRPPSAGEFSLDDKQKASDKAAEIKENAGRFYRMMNESVASVLENLQGNHPSYDPEAGYEIAGFVWFQGFNDQFSEEWRNNYAKHMISFIKDVRRNYKTPEMPVVIGVLGTGATKDKVDTNGVSLAQREAARHPEFRGNVRSVESYEDYSNFSMAVYQKGWPAHYHQWDTVGSDRPYHYLGSGAFFVRLGDSFAQAMAGLIAEKKN